MSARKGGCRRRCGRRFCQHGHVNGHLMLTDGSEVQDIKPAGVEEALHAGQLLWADLHDSSADSLALLKDVFDIQRPG